MRLLLSLWLPLNRVPLNSKPILVDSRDNDIITRVGSGLVQLPSSLLDPGYGSQRCAIRLRSDGRDAACLAIRFFVGRFRAYGLRAHGGS
jgi:hypothetical protein